MESYLLHVDAVAGAAEDETGFHRLGESLCLAWGLAWQGQLVVEARYLIRDFLLLFSREIDKVVVLCADQERYRGLVKASALAIPLLYGVEGALASQVEHEQNGNGVVADERQHVDKLALAAEIPDGEGDLGVPNRDCLLHEIDT